MAEVEVLKVVDIPMGADVPEWLLAVEPDGPDARPGHSRFRRDVRIVELTDCFILYGSGITDTGPLINHGDIFHCRISAASKRVWAVSSAEVIFPLEEEKWVMGLGAFAGDLNPYAATQRILDDQMHIAAHKAALEQLRIHGKGDYVLGAGSIISRPWWRRLLDGLSG